MKNLKLIHYPSKKKCDNVSQRQNIALKEYINKWKKAKTNIHHISYISLPTHTITNITALVAVKQNRKW
jgi:hypothetical protein